MYISLNLASKPLLSHRRFYVGAVLVGILGAILLLLLGLRFYRLQKMDEEYRTREAKVQKEMALLMEQRQALDRFYAQQENLSLQERAKFISGVVEARSFNWTKMFMDLEHTLPPGVRVVKIEPKLAMGHVEVKLVVATTTPESKIKLLEAFEDSKSFSHVELISEQLPKQGGGDAPTVEFTTLYSGI